MLVIRRKPGEALLIGSDVEIEILDSSASYVKLGIRAPKTIPIVRKEIQVVGEQNRAASHAVSSHSLESVLVALDRNSPSHRRPPLR